MRQTARAIRGEVNGKIFAYYKIFPGFDPKKIREELYDVTSDPYQQKDLIKDPKYKDALSKLKADFNRYADKNGDFHIEDLPAKGPYDKGNYRKDTGGGAAGDAAGKKGGKGGKGGGKAIDRSEGDS